MSPAQRLRALAKRTALDSIGEELVAIAQELDSSKALSWLAACKTLQQLGYAYHGAELWKPPLGLRPAAQTEREAPYGYCPECGAPGVTRERRPDGDDKCSNGHRYPSRSAHASLPTQPAAQATPEPVGEVVAWQRRDRNIVTGEWSEWHEDDDIEEELDPEWAERRPLFTRPAPVVPEWIVNDLGELGVKVGDRFFFLYKGDNIEYGKRGDSVSDSGVALHDDCTPMRYRTVGKVEFGETCWPAHWVRRGYGDDRYTLELVYEPGLSDGTPQHAEWRFLPAASQAKGGGA